MSDESKKRRMWSRSWIWWAVVLLVLYPLSAGPALLLCTKAKSDFALVSFGIAYTPLIEACDESPPLKSAMRWYVHWWLD
ncbi:MAG TPA: hypothetical protein VGP76_03990 [Planctomycetaceae bacterium]|jgi:hypothetical protein|nr:hypothetical protein [Planctomycetaceae bacterium]